VLSLLKSASPLALNSMRSLVNGSPPGTQRLPAFTNSAPPGRGNGADLVKQAGPLYPSDTDSCYVTLLKSPTCAITISGSMNAAHQFPRTLPGATRTITPDALMAWTIAAAAAPPTAMVLLLARTTEISISAGIMGAEPERARIRLRDCSADSADCWECQSL
jgi:hypothetical protein